MIETERGLLKRGKFPFDLWVLLLLVLVSCSSWKWIQTGEIYFKGGALVGGVLLIDAAMYWLISLLSPNLIIPLIRNFTRGIVGIVGSIMLLDNVGIDIAGLVAALGLGGAALAFASKDVLSNVYASVTLTFDGAFKQGDHISIDGKYTGKVLSIGLRSTRIDTPKGIFCIPNGRVASSVILNLKPPPSGGRGGVE